MIGNCVDIGKNRCIIKVQSWLDDRGTERSRGKSGLRRAGCRITSGGGDSQDSATEIKPLF